MNAPQTDFANLSNTSSNGDPNGLGWSLNPDRSQALVAVPQTTVRNLSLWRNVAIGLAATTLGVAAWGQHEMAESAVSAVKIEGLTKVNDALTSNLNAANQTITQQAAQLAQANKDALSRAQENGRLKGRDEISAPIVQRATTPQKTCTRPETVTQSNWARFTSYLGIGNGSTTVNHEVPCP